MGPYHLLREPETTIGFLQDHLGFPPSQDSSGKYIANVGGDDSILGRGTTQRITVFFFSMDFLFASATIGMRCSKMFHELAATCTTLPFLYSVYKL